MAAKKQQIEDVKTPDLKNVKPIVLKDEKNGDVFVLEFNRSSIKFAEARGFNLGAMDESGVSITIVEELFFYAFRMHHPNMTKADTDKILYEKLCGMPEKMIERLVELYAIPLNALVQTEDSAKNASMTAEF